MKRSLKKLAGFGGGYRNISQVVMLVMLEKFGNCRQCKRLTSSNEKLAVGQTKTRVWGGTPIFNCGLEPLAPVTQYLTDDKTLNDFLSCSVACHTIAD